MRSAIGFSGPVDASVERGSAERRGRYEPRAGAAKAGFESAYAFTGFADVAVRGDTVAVAFALTDTIYLFRQDGTRVGTVPWTARHFRPLMQPAAMGGTRAIPEMD
jgi:hypothetical protein